MNPFNQLNGMDYINPNNLYSADDLSGLFSKIKKGLSKLNSARKKITKKILPKAVYDAGTKLANNKLVQGVALVAASTFLTPAAGALLKGAGVAGAKAAGVAALKGAATKVGLVKLAGKAALKNVAGKAVSAAIKIPMTTAKIAAPIIQAAAPQVISAAAQQAAQRKAEAEAAKMLADAQARVLPMFQSLMSDPKFKAIADNMLAQGATPQQIVDMWNASQPAKELATAAAVQAVYDPIRQGYINQGIPPQQAAVYAEDTALEVAEGAVQKSTGSGAGVALLAIPLLMAVLGG